MTPPQNQPQSVTGVQLAQGVGQQAAQGFWAEAWSRVLKRPAAIFGLSWIALVSFFAVFAPLFASGHPVVFRPAGDGGGVTSPLITALKSSDVALLSWVFLSTVIFLLARKLDTAARLRLCIAIGIQAAITVILATVVATHFSARDASEWVRAARQSDWFIPTAAGLVALTACVPFLLIGGLLYRSLPRVALVIVLGVFFAVLVGWKWTPQLRVFDYRRLETTTNANAIYTLVPFSPNQSATVMFNRPPGTTPMHAWWNLTERQLLVADSRITVYSDEELATIPASETQIQVMRRVSGSVADLLSVPVEDILSEAIAAMDSGSLVTLKDLREFLLDADAPMHLLGTDTLGQDVLSQMLHASRLSISIGFVSTGIAVLIGVTIGAIMGYFGGWIDLLLYRVVEIFMAIPVLFVLIVAAGVLPRNIYFMMAILGCFTWTGAARFTRAEFMKLRNADYIQAARATGLPLWSILFRHMLPNGVTPVLVDTSFAIAAAILIEAILSFLGLGPPDQASWGKLLSNSIGDAGGYMWWLAIFPGGAIFLTALSYNLIGEALRDAIDPKLKKARV